MNYVQLRTGFRLLFADMVHITELFPELRLPVHLAIHQSALCAAAKTTVLGESACMHCKHVTQTLAHKRKNPWIAVCDVGVQEVVWPIWHEKTILGTLHFGQTAPLDASEVVRARWERRVRRTGVLFETFDKALDAMPETSRKGLMNESHYLHLVEDIIITVLEQHHWMPFHFLANLSDSVGIRKNSVLVRRTFDYVQKNYSGMVSARGVSQFLGYDEKYFSRIFTRDAGLHFHKFLALYRVGIAKRLLKNSRLSIMEVSERVGFQDSNYFSSTFRKLAGDSPSHFRGR